MPHGSQKLFRDGADPPPGRPRAWNFSASNQQLSSLTTSSDPARGSHLLAACSQHSQAGAAFSDCHEPAMYMYSMQPGSYM